MCIILLFIYFSKKKYYFILYCAIVIYKDPLFCLEKRKKKNKDPRFQTFNFLRVIDDRKVSIPL